MIYILLVEDNPGDTQLVKEAFNEINAEIVINDVNNGEDAIEFLTKQGLYANFAVPDLIILDLNLPRKDGREVLREIKNDNKLKQIPGVILTSSDAEFDIINSYNNHANCYIRKPVGLEEFIERMRIINQFWFNTVMLPDSSF